MELHLVADTNLFFEFKPLEQLPWGELGGDPVVILLTKPVLDEIDRHKKGTGRTRDRALDIFNRFRAMLTSGVAEVDIQASAPRVVLRRMTNVLPDPGLKDHLDYDKADERLVGIVSTLSSQAAGSEVKLFTDDGGPAGTAADLGVPFLMIDQSWRRPPAESTEAKLLKETQKDLAMYRSQEPKIAIRCENADQDKTVRVVRRVAAPLEAAEIERVLDKLRLKHPMVRDFNTPPASATTEPSGEIKTVVFSAPPADEVAVYHDTRYPQWTENCRQVLRELHVGRDEAEPTVILRWSMSNAGTRPASKVRVEFEAKGPLKLKRLRDEATEDDAESDDRQAPSAAPSTPGLPPPPKPPAFGETVTRSPAPPKPKLPHGFDIAAIRAADPFADRMKSAADAMKLFDRSSIAHMSPGYLEAMKAASGVSRLFQDPAFGSHIDRLLKPDAFAIATPRFEPLPNIRPFTPEKHKPEAFYYSWPVGRPVQKGALTCDFWRHQTEEEVFEFEVVVDKAEDARGVVECAVHAENLTKPEQEKVIVDRRNESMSMLGLAESLVDACG
jgi:hypothetical protein